MKQIPVSGIFHCVELFHNLERYKMLKNEYECI